MTQMTFGYSRDDIGKFLPFYLEHKLLPADPFAVLDQEGVGEMIRIGIERGRRTRADLKVGHLRRARRRAVVGGLLPSGRHDLRLVLALLGAHRVAGGRPGRAAGASPRRRAAQTDGDLSHQGDDEVKLPGARIVLECLKREGVDIIFGLPGGAVFPIYDALYDFEGSATSSSARRPPPGMPRRATRAPPARSASAWSPRGRRRRTW